jgi:hypothetical protein
MLAVLAIKNQRLDMCHQELSWTILMVLERGMRFEHKSMDADGYWRTERMESRIVKGQQQDMNATSLVHRVVEPCAPTVFDIKFCN